MDRYGQPQTRFRILTTTYIGATEARAVDALASLPGVEVRISLDGRRNRLHAKAWLFHRSTGFGTAFVGSANLSESALIGGIEWTVKFTEAERVCAPSIGHTLFIGFSHVSRCCVVILEMTIPGVGHSPDVWAP
jgi:hypothetical protein